jgi:hypothetical protein
MTKHILFIRKSPFDSFALPRAEPSLLESEPTLQHGKAPPAHWGFEAGVPYRANGHSSISLGLKTKLRLLRISLVQTDSSKSFCKTNPFMTMHAYHVHILSNHPSCTFLPYFFILITLPLNQPTRHHAELPPISCRQRTDPLIRHAPGLELAIAALQITRRAEARGLEVGSSLVGGRGRSPFFPCSRIDRKD